MNYSVQSYNLKIFTILSVDNETPILVLAMVQYTLASEIEQSSLRSHTVAGMTYILGPTDFETSLQVLHWLVEVRIQNTCTVSNRIAMGGS